MVSKILCRLGLHRWDYFAHNPTGKFYECRGCYKLKYVQA